MIDKAENWVASYLSIRKNVQWTDFELALVARFRDNIGDNAVEKFNKLSQNGNIETYIDEFENYRSLISQKAHNLSDEYVLDSFIGGMKDTIKPFVRAFKLTTISEAIEYARLHKHTLSSLNLNPHKKYPTLYYPSHKRNQPCFPCQTLQHNLTLLLATRKTTKISSMSQLM